LHARLSAATPYGSTPSIYRKLAIISNLPAFDSHLLFAFCTFCQ
jgi:hypothetical protein